MLGSATSELRSQSKMVEPFLGASFSVPTNGTHEWQWQWASDRKVFYRNGKRVNGSFNNWESDDEPFPRNDKRRSCLKMGMNGNWRSVFCGLDGHVLCEVKLAKGVLIPII